MATYTVDPGDASSDYDSLNLWEDAVDGVLTEIQTAERHATGTTADTTVCFIDGSTTDATKYMSVTVHTDHRHAGVFSTSKAYMNPWGCSLYLNDNYTRVSGLQFTSTRSNDCILRSDSGTNLLIEECIIHQPGEETGIKLPGWGVSVTVRNCVIVGAGSASPYGVYADLWDTGSLVIENCTIANFNVGIRLQARVTAIIKNTYSGGCATSDYTKDASATWTFTTCASSDSTSRSGVTASVAYSTSSGAYFTNVTSGSEDLHIGASSSLVNAGTDLSSTFTKDIDGVTRSGTWDIGADEYVAAGGSVVMPVFAYYYDHMRSQ